jgi:hypothetical protein
MFAALIAVCALMLQHTDGHRKTAKNLDAGYTLSVEAPTMPLIVVSDSAAILAASPLSAGHTFAGLGLETGIHIQAPAIDSEVSARVLILHTRPVANRNINMRAHNPSRRRLYARSDSTKVVRFVRAQTWINARA